MPEPTDDLPSLEALQNRIDRAKPPEDEEDRPQGSDGSAMNLATEFMAAVVVGGAMGYCLDVALGTLPIFFILFFLLGFAAGVRSLLRNYK